MAHGFRHGSGGALKKVPVLNEAYPQDVSVNEVGTSVSFSVLVAEAGSPNEYTYQWYYDGVAITGAIEAGYTMNAEFGSHTVFCVVSNEAGMVTSREATVTAEIEYIYKTGTIYPIASDIKMKDGKNALSKQTSQLKMSTTGNNVWDHCYFTKTIDLTKYKTLYFVGKVTITGAGDYWGQFEFGAYSSLSSSAASKISGAKSQGTHSVDVSKLTGKYYVSFYLKGFANYAVAEVQQVYLK